MKKYTIDRFEGEKAILEDFETMDFIIILKSELPSEACEGDIVEFNNGIYKILENETINKKESIKNRFEKLRKK